MNDFFSKLSSEEQKVITSFLKALKNGEKKKRILPNIAKGYPLKTAYKSFIHYIKQDDTKKLMRSPYK